MWDFLNLFHLASFVRRCYCYCIVFRSWNNKNSIQLQIASVFAVYSFTWQKRILIGLLEIPIFVMNRLTRLLLHYIYIYSRAHTHSRYTIHSRCVAHFGRYGAMELSIYFVDEKYSFNHSYSKASDQLEYSTGFNKNLVG